MSWNQISMPFPKPASVKSGLRKLYPLAKPEIAKV